MTYILHIDTSGETGLVALAADGKVLGQRTNTDTRNHAATINIYISEVVKEAGISLSDLSAIAVCGGPGSYTGLRIGLATAKGLCYALDKPLLQHNKLLLLAVNQHYKFFSEYELYISIMPARDKEFFISIHTSEMVCVMEPKHVFEDELVLILDKTDRQAIVTGDFPEHIIKNKNLHTIKNQSINIENWTLYTFGQYNCNETVNLSTAEPFYLKDVYTHKQKTIN